MANSLEPAQGLASQWALTVYRDCLSVILKPKEELSVMPKSILKPRVVIFSFLCEGKAGQGEQKAINTERPRVIGPQDPQGNDLQVEF